MARACSIVSMLHPTQGRLASRFGIRPGRTSGLPTFHAGLDLMATRGTPVYAIAEGTVQVVARDVQARTPFWGYGNCIAVKHESLQLWSFYAHLNRVVETEPGEPVALGKVIGEVGNSTNGRFPGMGVHLHFELRRAGAGGRSPYPGPYRVYNIDPEPWLAEQGVSFARSPRGAIVVTSPACMPPGPGVA